MGKHKYRKSLIRSKRQILRDVNKYLNTSEVENYFKDNTEKLVNNMVHQEDKQLNDMAYQVDKQFNNRSYMETSSGTSTSSSNLSCDSERVSVEYSENAVTEVIENISKDDGLKEIVFSYPIEKNNIPTDEIIKKLQKWAVDHNITYCALRDLLQLWKMAGIDVPLDPRTLLKTSTQQHIANIIKIENGEYVYIGIEENLKRVILHKTLKELHDNNNIKSISFAINIDGLQIFNSTNDQIWPILCAVNEENVPKPFVVALFVGKGKPHSIEAYLNPFIKELLHLSDHGFFVNNQKYVLNLQNCFFVCDAPAKAYIKCIKQHSGYYSCDRCCQKGKWFGKVTFQKQHARARTDISFRNKTQVEHHIATSPLEDLPINMIEQFPIDYMHLVCLGITRRLLLVWFRGNRRNRHSASDKKRISARLMTISVNIPTEFSRLPRKLEEMDRWKATEYRQFLLYTGPVVLKTILNMECYNNFILLSVAIRKLLSNPDDKEIELCRSYIFKFIDNCKYLYGPDFLVYNVHCLSHLCDDVKKFGNLESFSAFKFENYLGYLKTKIRARKHVTAQLVNRLNELSNNVSNVLHHSSVKGQHCNGPLFGLSGMQYKIYYFNQNGFQVRLDVSCRNNCILLLNGDVVLIRNIILENNGNVFILNNKYKSYKSIFKNPVRSSELFVYEVSELADDMNVNNVHDIYCKCIKLCIDDKIYILPMI